MTDQPPAAHAGIIKSVEPRSLAKRLGINVGDLLVRVNGQLVEDVIDVQFYAAEYQIELELIRDGKIMSVSGSRREREPLGLNFEHPTFDIDVRRCNNLCEFCFVLQMAPRMRRSLYIKDDDYRYSFLFGHFVTLTNLSEHDEWRIVNQHLSPLYVSVHAVDPAVRRECLRNENAPDIIPQLQYLAAHRIELHTQIVVTPGMNDGVHLKTSVETLAALYPSVKSVSVVPVGLTKQHKYGKRQNSVEEANQIIDNCHSWQAHFKSTLGATFVYPTDEWYLVTSRPIPDAVELEGVDLWANGLGMVRRFIDDWSEVKTELMQTPKFTKMTLATATLFATTLAKYSREFSDLSAVETEVVSISNERLGDSITVAGLLMGADVIDQLSKRILGDVVVLPRLMFDHPDGISLDDVSPLQIAKALNRPVALADLMGDLVDIVNGKPALYFDPNLGVQIPINAIQTKGGWAVEKYL